MTSDRDILPDELTGNELDLVLAKADEELLEYVRGTADRSAALVKIMAADGTSGKSRLAAWIGKSRLGARSRNRSRDRARAAASSTVTAKGRGAVAIIAARVRVRKLERHIASANSKADLLASANAQALEATQARAAANVSVLDCRQVLRQARRAGEESPFLEQRLKEARDRRKEAALFSAGAYRQAYRYRNDLIAALKLDLRLAVALCWVLARVFIRVDAVKVAFPFARALTVASICNMWRAYDLMLRSVSPGLGTDIARNLFKMFEITRKLVRQLDTVHADVSGANLSRVDLSDFDVLVGVVWTRDTKWPDGMSKIISESSDEISPGVFRVRSGNDRDRGCLTAVLRAERLPGSAKPSPWRPQYRRWRRSPSSRRVAKAVTRGPGLAFQALLVGKHGDAARLGPGRAARGPTKARLAVLLVPAVEEYRRRKTP
jgi:hypothetical protein